MILWSIAILGVVWFDVIYNHDVLLKSSNIYDVMGPINILTFVGGVSVVALSVVISHIPWLKGKEGANGTV